MAPDRDLHAIDLWRYPVKSLRGERLARAEIEPAGVRGDRLLRVDGEQGLITARTRPGLLRLRAVIGADGEPEINGEPWDSDGADHAISSAAPGGRLVSTDGAEVGLRQDLSPVHVITTSMVAELGVDFRRLRPNILIDGAEGREEIGWIGSNLRIGDVVLEVTSQCERCVMTTFDPDTIEADAGVLKRINADFARNFGLHCDVAVPGTVSRGDPVIVEEA
jgi:uncharacterized protein YcbX